VTSTVELSAENALESTIATYARLADENKALPFRWDEGIGLMLFGHPRTGLQTLVSGRTSPLETRSPRCRIPLFENRPRRNALLQGVSNRLPAWTAWLAGRTFRQDLKFDTNLRTWTFFQSSYDDANRLLARRGTGWAAVRALGQIDPRLHMVHQSWLVPRKRLLELLELHAELISEPRFRGVVSATEMQDAIPTPWSASPLHPAHASPDGSHLFSMSLSAHERRRTSRALLTDYCATLSELCYGRIEGFRVHLLKQLHADDALLRRMYRDELDALRKLKLRVDPSGRIGSRVLERLLG
jgi:hypothetical protein